MVKRSSLLSSTLSTAAVLIGLMILVAATIVVVDGQEIGGEGEKVWEARAQPRRGWNTFVRACYRELTPECADELFHFIFNRKQPQDIAINCCNRLVQTGLLCHRALSHTLSRSQAFSRWKGHIYQRSLQGYQDCLRRV